MKLRKVMIDYQARYRPGIPVIVCEKDGRIIYQRDGIKPKENGRAKNGKATAMRRNAPE